MRRLTRRAMVVAGTVVMAVGASAAVAVAGTSGTPVLSWSPATAAGTFSYGTVNAGSSTPQTFTLSNSGGNASSALQVAMTGSAAFSITSDTCTGTSLGPQKSCSVTVVYAPAASGQNDSATLTATSNKPAATTGLTLKGTTVSPLTCSSSAVPAGGPAGTSLQDAVTLSGGDNPSGAIEFALVASDNSVAATSSVTVSGDNTYLSPAVTAPAAGSDTWVANYIGDASNAGCLTTAPVSISLATPAIATSASLVSGPGSTGTSDTATVTGGYQPSGTVTFSLYGPSIGPYCGGTPLYTETDTVINGSASTLPYYPQTTGTYWWIAQYSGDSANASVSTNCGDESVSIPL